jgi:thymidylate synthase ThyX
MRYSAQLHAPKSSKKRDLSDLNEAIVQARMGFDYLSSEPNKGLEYMNKAIAIWENAMKEYSGSKKARISPDVMKAILKNATEAAIFTHNWEFALRYMNQLKTMKLKSLDNAHLNVLNNQYQDLKKRYDALKN